MKTRIVIQRDSGQFIAASADCDPYDCTTHQTTGNAIASSPSNVIMAEKGYLRRRQEASGYIYTASVKRANTLRKMLSDLVDRAFSGSRVDAILQLLDISDLDAEDIARLRGEVDRKLKEHDS